MPGYIRDGQNTWIYQRQTEYLDLSETDRILDISEIDRIPGYIRDRQNTWIYQRRTEYLDLSETDRIPEFIRDGQNT